MAGGEVRYRLVADASAFSSGIRTAEAEFNKFTSTIAQGIGLGAGFSVGKEAAEALISTIKAIPAAFAESITSAIAFASSIEDASQRTGVAAEKLQEMRVSAMLSSVSFESLQGALGKMAKAIETGSAEFGKLGLSLSELQRMSPDQAFEKIGSAITKLSSPMERTAALMAIFGRAGAQLIPMFNTMAEGAESTARSLGLVMSSQMVSTLENMGDKVDLLKATWTGLWNNLGAGIASTPALAMALDEITSAIGGMSTAAQDGTSAIQSYTTQGLDLAAEGLKSLLQVIGEVKADVGELSLLFQELGENARTSLNATIPRLGDAAAGILKDPFSAGTSAGQSTRESIAEMFGGHSTPWPWESGAAAVTPIDPRIVALQQQLTQLQERMRAAPFMQELRDEVSQGGESAPVKGLQQTEAQIEKTYEAWKKMRDMVVAFTLSVAEDARGLEAYNSRLDQTEMKLLGTAGLLDPDKIGLFPTPERPGSEGYGPVPGRIDPLAAHNELLRRTKELQDAAAASAQHWASAMQDVANVLGTLSDLMAQLGVSADSTAGRVVHALGGMASAGSTIFQGISSGNGAQVLGGIMQGLGSAIHLVSAIFGGESQAEHDARIIGQVIGHGVSEQMVETIHADAIRLHTGLTQAALINLPQIMSQQGAGPASSFAPQISQLLSGILSASIPAREGVAALSDAFGQLADEAEKSGGYASSAMLGIISRVEAAHLQVASVMKYVTEQAQVENDSLKTLFDGVQEGSARSGNSLSMFASITADTFDKLRAEGLSFVQIFRVIGPAIDAGAAAFQRMGIEMPAALSGLVDLKNLVGENSDLLSGIDAFGAMLKSSLNLGLINAANGAERLAQAGNFVAGRMNDLAAAGFSAEQALAIMGPTLGTLHDAAERLHIPLDEATEALYQQAKAAGDIPTSAMDQLVAASQRLVGVLELIAIRLGVAREELERFNSTPQPNAGTGPPSPPPPPGSGDPKGGSGGEGMAKGGIVMPRRGGVLKRLAEAGYPEAVIPLDGAHHGMLGGGGSTVNGGIVIHIDGARDPRIVADEVVSAIRGNYKSSDGVGVRTALVLSGPR